MADMSGVMIHIVHKHPDFRHKVRSDLDPEELVVAGYPMALANKIVPFLGDHIGSPLQRNRSSPTRKLSPRRKRIRHEGPEQERKSSWEAAQSTQINAPSRDRSSSLIQFNSNTGIATPARQLLPPPKLTKRHNSPAKVDTVQSARTISPNGTRLSPLKNNLATPSRLPRLPPSELKIPTAMFSPPHESLLHTSTNPPVVRRTPTIIDATNIIPKSQRARSRCGRLIVAFEETPRMIDHTWPLPVLVLRHEVNTQALRDVFLWCKECVAQGEIVELQGWLVHFKDITRLREIWEVCMILNLKRQAEACEQTQRGWTEARGEQINGLLSIEEDLVDKEPRMHEIKPSTTSNNPHVDIYGNVEGFVARWTRTTSAALQQGTVKMDHRDDGMDDVPLAQIFNRKSV